MQARAATPEDASAIARIYNEGIEDRVATFETRRRSADDVRAWFDGVHPVVVVEDGGDLLAFASTGAYEYSMSSNYNKVGRPAVVGVAAARPRLLARRETFDDLARLDVD